jgi:hypothetical protein
MAAPSLEQRPQLTLPPDAAEELRSTYEAAQTILEYGSGGSTVVAAEMAGKRVFSVESDAGWAKGMQDWFTANPPPSEVTIHYADIGPTGAWGSPKDTTLFKRWPGYALSVWDRPDFIHPDVVLIDGRFRPACFATTALRITRPVTVLFDDYAEREPYHQIEEFARPVRMAGRMARFELEPRPFPVDRMAWIVGLFLKPR